MNIINKFIKSFYYIPFFKVNKFYYKRLFWKIPNNIEKNLSFEMRKYYPWSKFIFLKSWTMAIQYALEYLINKRYNKRTILMPEMMCEKVTNMVKYLWLNIVFYKIKTDLSIDLDNIKDILWHKLDVLSIIVPHYWWIYQKNIEVLKKYIKYKKYDIPIIDDAAQWFPVSKAWYIWDFGIVSFGRWKFLTALNWWVLIINNIDYIHDMRDQEPDSIDYNIFKKIYYVLYYVYSSYFQSIIYAFRTIRQYKSNKNKKISGMKLRDMILIYGQMKYIKEIEDTKRMQFTKIKESVIKYEKMGLVKLINSEESVFTKLIIYFDTVKMREKFQNYLLNKRIASDIWFDNHYTCIPTWTYISSDKICYMINRIKSFFKSLIQWNA